MTEEVLRWLRQAERDLKSAGNSFNALDYYVSAFLSQQSVEKALKAYSIKTKNELPKTHSVLKLAKTLKLPDDMVEKIASLEPVYQESRYPDVSDDLPADEFNEQDAKKFSAIAHEVVEWIRNKIEYSR